MAVDESCGKLLTALRGACRRLPAATTLPLWRDLLAGSLQFSEVVEKYRHDPRLTYLTIDTSSVCDLTCPGMCYYHPGIDVKQKAVSEDALCETIRAAHEEFKLQNLVFAGKEPLVGAERLVRLVEYAVSLPDRRFAIGVVTNGRGVARHWERLSTLADSLAFVDFSIDSGFPAQHDAIRGREGTFELAFAALQQCRREWPQVRIGATSVLRDDNADGILELIRRAQTHTRNFFITPIQPPPFTPTPVLPWSAVAAFISRLQQHLETEWQGQGLEVMISFLGIFGFDALEAGFFSWDELKEDGQGQVYVEREVGGNTLQIHLQVFPETACRVARILHTGAYLPNAHFVQDYRPERYAVGNVAEEPLSVLYARSLEDDGILARMYASREEHTCRMRKCWPACFGGLAAAEHNIVCGTPLEKQPRLCLKTERDFVTG